MEAYGATTAASDDLSAVETDRPDRRRVRAVNMESKETKIEMRQLQRLESELADHRRQIRQLQAESDHWKARAESAAAAPLPVLPPTPWWPPASGSYPPYAWTDYGVGSGSQPLYDAAPTAGVPPWAAAPPAAASTTPLERPPSEPRQTFQKGRDFRPRRPLAGDICKSCGLKGHWARKCPSRDKPATATTTGGSSEDMSTPTTAAINQARVTGVSASILGAETYVKINVKGIKAQCLVDSGCGGVYFSTPSLLLLPGARV